MKIGIFGGTFNPPHIGHISSAKAAALQLALDMLIVVPTGIPPHKAVPTVTPPADMRCAMARLSFGDIDGVTVTDREIVKNEPSYTINTVNDIMREYPDTRPYLLVGADMYLSLPSWYNAEALMKKVTLAVVARESDDMAKVIEYSRELQDTYGAETVIIESKVIDISSSTLREALPKREGTRYIADTTYEYIIKYRLYNAKPDWDWLRTRAYSMLQPSRVPHVKGCEMEAVRLAERWGADTDDAREAAILHDITKKLGLNEHLEILKDNGVRIGSLKHAEEKLLHAKTGAVLAKTAFGVNRAVEDAITWHTTGRVGMTELEKIIYIADYIEPERVFDGVTGLRELAYKDLGEAVMMGLEMSIKEIKSRGIEPNRASLDALAAMRKG